MATEKNTALTSRGNVVTTELNALADGSYSAVSAEFDNSTNLDRFGIAELTVTFGSAPTDGAPVHLFAVTPEDGTNYVDGGGSVRPSEACYLGTFQVRNVTTAQRIKTKPFELPNSKMKFVVYDGTGQAFPGSGSIVALYTFNRQTT